MIPDPPVSISRLDALEQERKVMEAYSDTAKTYAQLSLGALALSVTFVEKVTGSNLQSQNPFWLYAAWCLWLISAVAGAVYQYLAVRFVEARAQRWGLIGRTGHYQAFKWLGSHPWPVYACMLITFALGSISFVAYGISQLKSR